MPRNRSRLLRGALPALGLMLGLGGASAWAGPPSAPAAPPVTAAPAARVIPDYGGRAADLGHALDGGVGAAVNPLAQAGRSFEALVVVLVVVAGGLALLKRSGLLKGVGAASGGGGAASLSSLLPRLTTSRPSGPPAEGATELLSLLGSQTLPHSPGAGLHLVSVGGRVLLLGATGQSVTLLTEVAEFAAPPPAGEPAETPEEVAAFADYLARVGVGVPVGTGAESTRASLSAATDRLQSLLSRGAK